MRTIYIVQLSEDGLDNSVYTNIKALYNGILSTGYNVLEVGDFGDESKFSYENLNKKLKKSTDGNKKYARTMVWCAGSSIEINELPVVSK